MFPTSDDEADQRWAYGTGFSDPFEGLELAAPGDESLARRCLMLADDALIYSHRLQEWVTRLPELEEETALANIALDLLGQARLLLTRAGHILGSDEDRLAFFRDAGEFRNVRLVERRDRDFAELVTRLLVFSTWRLALLQRVTASPDPALAAIAAKAAIELAYHRDYAAGWVIRLGDGTEVSRKRMRAAIEAIWPLVDELFVPDPLLPEAAELRAEFDETLDAILVAATLGRPPAASTAESAAGRSGAHTADLDEILDEMQGLARAHPLGAW